MRMTIQQAVEAWERSYRYLISLGDQAIPVNMDFARITLEALREKAEREDPKPLTLKDLRQMDGEPVWIRANHYGIFADVVKISGRDDGDNFVGVKLCYRLRENGYGKTWICYRHKPKEG